MKTKTVEYIPLVKDLNLHQKSKILSVHFSNGKQFDLPCEYLRIHSPAAEVKLLQQLETGKETVNITDIEVQGQYAIRISFDDGHNTGIYSWQTLYKLGMEQTEKWQHYLNELDKVGYVRGATAETDKPRQITVLYFNYLANKLYKEKEIFDLPKSVQTAEELLHFLQKIKLDLGYLLAAETIQLTVNKQFSETFTQIEDGDEIGIIPNSPNPPKKG